MPKPKFCAECEIEFTVTHEETRAFYPIMYCPFCGVDLYDDSEVTEELDFDENEEV